MSDFLKHKVEVECPKCKSKISVTLKQIAEQQTVICRCGQSIKLVDNDGSVKKTVNKIDKSLDNLFKSFGK